MEHAGIVFPDEYVRHGKPLIYDGQEIVLSSELEEIATFYATMPEDGPQLLVPLAKRFKIIFSRTLRKPWARRVSLRNSLNVTLA